MSKVRGKFSCLLINDLDAGIGHFKDTQVTVNNQVRAGLWRSCVGSCCGTQLQTGKVPEAILTHSPRQLWLGSLLMPGSVLLTRSSWRR